MRRIGITIAAVLALCAGTLALGSPASAQTARAAIAGSKPSWAEPGARVADAGASDTMTFRVYLASSRRSSIRFSPTAMPRRA